MIRFDSENAKLEISGTVMDISVESLAFIRSIYITIAEKDKKAAAVYKDFFVNMIKTAFLSREELNRQTEEARNETFRTMDSIKELLDQLKERMEHKNDKTDESENISDTLHDEFERFLHGED